VHMENGEQKELRTLEGHYDRIESIEVARKALLDRKRMSMRFLMYLCFSLVFLIALGTAVILIITNSRVEKKLRFLEITNDLTVEISQARRFEKNFFLYGTNLNDAMENIYHAKNILDQNRNELKKILGKDEHERIMSSFVLNINDYQNLLNRLIKKDRSEMVSPEFHLTKKEIEVKLRKDGREMIAFAQDLMKRERSSLTRILLLSRNLHIYSLIFLLIFLMLISYFLGGRLLGHINRFTTYAQRIASGNFTPITPTQRYRDEFTDLALAINQMIHELEEHEATIIQSHKMRAIGTLTAGVAHELNNPLNNITITAHMLLEDYDTMNKDEHIDMINDVINETDRSKKIISNLLDFARESSSQVESLDLEKLLRDTIDLASNQLKLSGIKISFQTTGNLPRIHVDGQQLQQVFLNLILNAVDASSKGKKIQILLVPADEPNYVAVKVIDTGKGIPRHIIGSIFDPFFTTKGKGKGTGLGLSVSQGIVGKHGGRIRVSSRERSGTIFTVILPITTIPDKIIHQQVLL
jgi:two-component system, NtrC family, sensor kinase